ncbi:hypothetical protein HRbin02_01621 [Candidatus Calditenuaceae archaeon HR02]|nr:hypothetical protein HRbin02_01621 [Candidatus Calditenuaceae archaeon HR02]
MCLAELARLGALPSSYIPEGGVARVRELRRAGYRVATIDQIAKQGIRNDELASLSIKHGMIIITRDVDFTRLKRDLMRKIKAIYVKLRMAPDRMAEYILNNLSSCIEKLSTANVVILDEADYHAI